MVNFEKISKIVCICMVKTILSGFTDDHDLYLFIVKFDIIFSNVSKVQYNCKYLFHENF